MKNQKFTPKTLSPMKTLQPENLKKKSYNRSNKILTSLNIKYNQKNRIKEETDLNRNMKINEKKNFNFNNCEEEKNKQYSRMNAFSTISNSISGITLKENSSMKRALRTINFSQKKLLIN